MARSFGEERTESKRWQDRQFGQRKRTCKTKIKMIDLHEERPKQVPHLKYLGPMIQEDGESEKAVKARE